MGSKKILSEVKNYYDEKIKTYGATPQGVDWNGVESQQNRFNQLLKILPKNDEHISLLDYGCGFGSLLEFTLPERKNLQFTGFDISDEMLLAAKNKFPEASWLNKLNEEKFDFTVASGIFNVMMKHNIEEWKEYVESTLIQMNALSTKGFAFNMLTSYFDAGFEKDYLFYADPCFYFDWCKKKFSKNVALLHDYNLYEFTILVRK